jgi:hypothetical protein
VGVARYDGALLTAAQSGVGKKVGTGPLVGVARYDVTLLTGIGSSSGPAMMGPSSIQHLYRSMTT